VEIEDHGAANAGSGTIEADRQFSAANIEHVVAHFVDRREVFGPPGLFAAHLRPRALNVAEVAALGAAPKRFHDAGGDRGVHDGIGGWRRGGRFRSDIHGRNGDKSGRAWQADCRQRSSAPCARNPYGSGRGKPLS
jgi:hypothetical protein